ncbi:MAG: TatD family hydrolase [Clostridia bacterium]|nr:TatD family hydrolase [Clostridia bacterium]
MKITDIHAHYDDEKFEGKEKELLTELFNGNVETIIGAATKLETSENQIKLAESFEGFYASVGIHPENADDSAKIEYTVKELEKMLSHPKVVAIGEIGLDYYWEDYPPREVQKKYFEAQIELAMKHGYPIVVHDREAHGDCLEIARKYKGVKGVFHSFSGSAEMAKELVSLGWYISFSGVVTFKNARKTVEAAEVVPLDRILTETDAPYLTPHPFRGTRNSSAYVSYIVEKLAEIKVISADEMAQTVAQNARKLFFAKETF